MSVNLRDKGVVVIQNLKVVVLVPLAILKAYHLQVLDDGWFAWLFFFDKLPLIFVEPFSAELNGFEVHYFLFGLFFGFYTSFVEEIRAIQIDNDIEGAVVFKHIVFEVKVEVVLDDVDHVFFAQHC